MDDRFLPAAVPCGGRLALSDAFIMRDARLEYCPEFTLIDGADPRELLLLVFEALF